jgi:hypothetical protein
LQSVIENLAQKIVTFKRIFVPHTSIILLLTTPPELRNLYKNPVE